MGQCPVLCSVSQTQSLGIFFWGGLGELVGPTLVYTGPSDSCSMLNQSMNLLSACPLVSLLLFCALLDIGLQCARTAPHLTGPAALRESSLVLVIALFSWCRRYSTNKLNLGAKLASMASLVLKMAHQSVQAKVS